MYVFFSSEWNCITIILRYMILCLECHVCRCCGKFLLISMFQIRTRAYACPDICRIMSTKLCVQLISACLPVCCFSFIITPIDTSDSLGRVLPALFNRLCTSCNHLSTDANGHLGSKTLKAPGAKSCLVHRWCMYFSVCTHCAHRVIT